MEVRPSFHQIHLMRHALGLDQSKKAYRNYYTVNRDSTQNVEELEELIRMGLMREAIDSSSMYRTFTVTNDGKKFCEGIR